ncbi:MAG TPA: dihydrofolate reductase family protein [Candidatus Saccharimonadales bacterium]|nr:dihydrofolate reductase family protein [Candidatus Saccharimonadales bacterium]
MKVFIVAAITADGFIGRTADHLADWSSKEDKKLFIKLTKEAGTMVMGSKTFATIGRALPGRKTIVYTREPRESDIVDVTFTNEPPADLVSRLTSEGHESLAICGGASIYSLFMESGVVDELYLTVEPVVFGTGVPLFGHTLENGLTLLSAESLNPNTVLLHYSVDK